MAGQGSARVTLREIDLSQVRDPEVLPQGVPAAVVGTAKRGPAFVPKTFANMQQFGEVFGSIREISKESNANRFGPLALNEWMRNAEAGTFLRLLGVGDGSGQMSDLTKKVQGAGFVVGDNIAYNANQELVQNPHADIDPANVVGAKKAARTHFLGCFMKDTATSTFLQDAGVQTSQAPGEVTIDFKAVPADDSYIVLEATDGTTKSIGFKARGVAVTLPAAVGGGNANAVVNTDGLTGATIATALEAQIFAQLNGLVTTTVTSDAQNATSKIVITQVEEGDAGNTEVLFDLKVVNPDKILVTNTSGSTANSVADAQIRMSGGGATAASVELKISDPDNSNKNLLNDDTLVLQAIDESLTRQQVTLTFENDATFAGGGGAAGAVGLDSEVFKTNVNNTDIAVRLGENGLNTLAGQKETLANIATAINSDNGSDIEGLLVATLSSDGTSLTLTQSIKGNVDNTAVPAGIQCTAEITAADNSGSSFTLVNQEVNNSNVTEHFGGGTDTADGASIVFKLSEQPRIDDNFTLIGLNVNGTFTTEKFVFVADNNGADNGADNGSGDIQIEISSSSVEATLDNIREAVTAAQSASTVKSLFTASVSGREITFTQVSPGFLGDQLVTFNMSDKSQAISGPASLVGNFGQKSSTFSGGGGAAAPVIRGLLITPQGVVPALDVDNASFARVNATNSPNAVKDVASGVNLISFGNVPATNLIGYEIGAVDSATQGFKLVLNGFSPTPGTDSEGEANTLSCSFDPENVNYFAKVMNTDPAQLESRGHYLHMHWDIDKTKALPDSTGLYDSSNQLAGLGKAAFCMHTSLDRATADGAIPDFESFDTRYRTAASPWFVSQSFGGTTYNLFKLHSLDDGTAGNDRFRILISNIRAGSNQNDYGSFDLSLEKFDSDPISGETLITWKRLSLDPDSKNYIARVIGTKHMYYDFDRPISKQRLIEEGEFEVRNKYVRVEMHPLVDSKEIDPTTLVAGFESYTTLNTTGTGLLRESGGASSLLPETTFDGLKVLPLPLIKSITRSNGVSTEASEALAWGVKFSKYEKSSELNDIRFNYSIKSWTQFMPDLGSDSEAKFGIKNLNDITESFSLERINVTDAANIDWNTSVYVRSGESASGQFIDLWDAASVGRNVKYLKFRCLMQGGFDGLNIFNKEKFELSSIAAYREANEEVDKVFNGPTIVSYKRAIDVLADKSAVEFQLLAIPGMREPLVADYAITACENRFDAMLIMDIQEIDRSAEVILSDDIKPSVEQTIRIFKSRLLDTSFAAAYFPDVIMRRPSNSSPLQVPPSVGMLGVMSQNDTLADPWFAPAGLTRGRLNAQNAKVQMNRDTLNDLYDADVNPIYEPAGRAGEVYAFGQKTMLQNQSALDRINVRRLLINIRRQVKAIANTLLFEPNRASTLEKFSSLVEPIMSNVKARQGVERYKVQIDTSTTTQNDVENNTIRGKIYLQPTKSVEFISLDFVVTNSID